MEDLLQVRNLRVSIALPECDIPAVKCVNFRIRPGSTVALVGESGSGKSMTAHAIMGLLPRQARIDEGEILFADPAAAGTAVDLAALRPNGAEMRALRGARMSMIFQEPMTSLSPLHTIGDQIGEALKFHEDCPGAERRARTHDLLRRVGFREPVQAYDAYPFELSGGLRQRAMIAMALICRPALLIADEPTTALDVTIQAQILKLIRDLQQEFGMAVLIITHDLGVVANLAEEIVVMCDGEVVEAGTRDDIFGNAQHPYLKALFEAVPRIGLDRTARLKPIHDSIATAPAAAANPRRPDPTKDKPANAEPVLKIDALSKSFGTRKNGLMPGLRGPRVSAVDTVTLSVRRGETLGLVGESGSGKSTLAKLIMRAIRPDAGSIVYCDGGAEIDVQALDGSGLAAYRRQVQYIFQDPYGSLDPRMTVLDIIAEPLVIHGIGSRADRIAAARDCMRLVGLDERFLNRYPHSFSGGQRQRIGIARALALKPALLICDEPVSALDVGIQAQILNLLRDLQSELGLTYLFVSHNLAVVDYIADRIAVMCRGRIVEIAPHADLFRRPMHPYTQSLLAAVPDTNLENRLDFDALSAGRQADPAAWPDAYRAESGRVQDMLDLGNGHFIRANVDVALEETGL
jgi:peptide/nickel transport system ATP-binding protein